ncbi:class III signal peptide-containing protein [Methanobacterium petrolearium]|uniref:class III signal peptide-containing protein n=1 Tax=Methanobacterium petrolearium TaxID=710190 RepID=UPI001AE5E75C|nr:class III signal peptide-containing protein [Methanobacterium petrolearium]BDZ71811.1 class III signal peptide-containing protein [Methanobacterium petrolearium]
MNFVNDEKGQGAAEYILLFGGVIVIAIAALLIYQSYINQALALNSEQDISAVRESVQNKSTG